MYPRFRHSLAPLAGALVLGLAACGRDEPRAADSLAAAGSVDPAALAASPRTPSSAPLGDTALPASPTTDVAAAIDSGQLPTAGTAPGAAVAGPAGPMQTPAPAPPPTQQQQPPQQHAPQNHAQPAASVAAAPAGTSAAGTSAASASRRAPVPFAPGERYVYDVKFGAVDVGDGVMEVLGLEEVRGREAYHVLFRVSGGTMFFKVRDRYESWMDTQSLASLRHIQDIDEASYERKSHFEIFPERGVYKENDKPEKPTVDLPLDDGSFFFFVRTVPLEVGRTYEFHRYFKPDRNPVKITVLRRERVKVPAGTFDAVVLQPTIKTKGVFGEGGRAEIWIADDSTRAMVQMKSKLKFGSLNLYLKSIRTASTNGEPVSRVSEIKK
ncbi:MAG: DUF3108 domain-containing protein [Gemmatimonadaceae bacterium]